MDHSDLVQRLAARLARPWRVVSTTLLITALAVYFGMLARSGSIPSLRTAWPFVLIGGVLGAGHLRRKHFVRYCRGLRRRWRRFRGTNDDWVDESAHDWGPDDESPDSEHASDEDDDDDSGVIHVLLLLTSLVSGTTLDLLFSDWLPGLILGALGVIVAARLLAWASPIREGMEPARRGVPACPSERDGQHSRGAGDGSTTSIGGRAPDSETESAAGPTALATNAPERR